MSEGIQWGEAIDKDLTRYIAKVRSDSLKANPETAKGLRSFAAWVSIQMDSVTQRTKDLFNSEDLHELEVRAELLSKELDLLRSSLETLKLFK